MTKKGDMNLQELERFMSARHNFYMISLISGVLVASLILFLIESL